MAVKWYDLSRFGAALRIVPQSPLRGTSLTCLEITDPVLFTSGWDWDGTQAGRTALQEAWTRACGELDFGSNSVTVREPRGNDEPDLIRRRFFSPRLKFTLREIQSIVPGVQASDLRQMQEEEIALVTQAAPEMPQAWQQFTFNVLASEGVGVWTPKINPFDKPWAEAEKFKEFRSKAQAAHDWNRMFTYRGVTTYGQMGIMLDDANYRTNALVPFYADQASALADGWNADELEQVDLPYALPLWVTRAGQVQALRDIRYMPEIMDMEPGYYFGRPAAGLAIGALRRGSELASMARGHVEQWAKWAADPASLELPDLFWGSITEIASAHAELHDQYPGVGGGGELELILDGKEKNRGGAFRARPLLEMDQTVMFRLAHLCARYVPMSADETALLQGALGKLLDRSRELMAEHVQALARESLVKVANAVRGDGSTATSEAVDVESLEFESWFGSSQVVDGEGRPLKVYHGTNAQFEEFDLQFLGANTTADNAALGFFFIADKELAKQFASETSGGKRVLAAYLSVERPLLLTSEGVFGNQEQAATLYEIFTGERLDAQAALAAINEEIGLGEFPDVAEAVASERGKSILERDGFDGVISQFGGGNLEYVAFRPSQVKIVDSDLGVELTHEQEAQPSPEKKVRHEDAGEKIGGARKDFAKRAMVYEDLEVMNEAEREIYVVKKNVWGPLDYQQMREDGVTAEAALAIKYIKDKLPTAPDRGARSRVPVGDGFDAQYIEAISLMRDHLAHVKTLDEFNVAAKTLYELGNRDHEGNPTRYIYGGSALQCQWGQDVSHMLYDAQDGRVIGKIAREIRRKVNVFGREATVDEQWRSMIKPKREKTEEQVSEEKTKAQIDRELHRPHLERVQREGEDWRAGRDIVADDLISHFGFRAVEFGNWLPQDERQQVLNMAFDSLCDLADALGLPPKGLSLDGTLACAFGSRGRGGKNAALAHFEPTRMVINLTRMNGAGSLAHEWMHALDWHRGGQNGTRSYLSESDSGKNTAMGRLTARMQKRFALEDEILESATNNARRGLSNARSWLYGQPQEVRNKMVDVLEGVYERATARFFDEAKQAIETGVERDKAHFAKAGFGGAGAVSWSVSSGLADETYDTIRTNCESKPALTKVKDKVQANINYMMANLAKACTIQALRHLDVSAPKAFCAGENALPSHFHAQATQLDKTRASAYWATTRELFARAGAAYVSDKLATRGHRSDYLVYGAEEERYADHPVGNPNPTGEERKVLVEHFDALMDEYRLACLKEVEQDALAEP